MDEYTISELQEKMRSGELTARELVRIYVERIELVDKTGPKLNSILEVNPDALSTAVELDAERLKGNVRGPLHGIPVIIKDNIDTADRMMTTDGSLALEGSYARRDAFLVERLRAAGAVILGKANLSEWANFRSTRSVSGWSSRGGQTRNPYALDRNPCGSSSGSAVAVSANLCAAAIGTETDGSIICPSQANGIVGIKPTLGLVSRSGIIPIAHSQDTAGPMARTVADAAILLSALTGVDERDPVTANSDGKIHTDYTQFLNPDGLKGARIGVARNFFDFDPRVDQLIDSCLGLMKALGAELIDPVQLITAPLIEANELIVLYYEFKNDLNAYLAGLGTNGGVHSMSDVIAFNERNRERVMPYFGQEHFYAAQQKGPLTDQVYLEALQANLRLARDEGIDAVLKEHRLDAIVAPSGGPAPLIDFITACSSPGGDCTSLPAVAGYPHITVPAGLIYNLPVGLSFFGTAFSEPVLLRLAYAFEQASQARQSPRYQNSVNIAC